MLLHYIKNNIGSYITQLYLIKHLYKIFDYDFDKRNYHNPSVY